MTTILDRLSTRAPGIARIACDERLWHRAFWACWLHDFGKGASGFQKMLREPQRTWDRRHEVLSLAFVPWVADPGSEDFAWISASIASHHRDANVILETLYDVAPFAEPDTRAVLSDMVAELDDATIDALIRFAIEAAPAWLATSTLPERGVELPSALQPDRRAFRTDAVDWIMQALRAYAALDRRLAAEQGEMPGRRQGVLLRGLVQSADHLGSAHAGAFDSLTIPDPSALLPGAGTGAESNGLRSHQRGARERTGSLVLAAPTGSGKTEAALLWASRQLEEPVRSRRLVYLLPYQASLNAMHTRLEQTIGVNVGLVHGKATQAIYRTLVEQEYRQDVAAAKAHAATNLARMHHPAVWVGTPYQLLRGAYRLKGYEQVWTALAGAQVVVDEPHAYEANRLGLILGLLAELVRNWDARICAMTATLPGWTRSLLERAVGANSLEIDRALFAQFRRHRVQLMHGDLLDETTLARIAGLANDGLTVLVGVNTIGRAQTTYEVLVNVLGVDHVRLLHGRFISEHRIAKEQEVIRLLGVDAERPTSDGLVVVSTQVIEVSLNLDFDTIVTEPAPLEALAQRFGRVNRRGKKGFDGVVPVYVLDQPRDGQHVYDDELVERTLQWLTGVDGIVVDEASLGVALDTIYGDDLSQTYTSQVESAWCAFNDVCIRNLRPFASDEELASAFDDLFDGTEVLPSCFVERYRERLEVDSLGAHGLLVPLSARQRHALRLRGLASWDRDLTQWIVDVPYDDTQGLLLPSTSPSG